MSFLVAVLGFLAAMVPLVLVHEWGHYWVAKRLGVKILRFSLGFGKPLLIWRAGRDQTEYVISALPFGGYVSMLGEKDGEALSADELPRAYSAQALWKRSLIVLAGPAANLLFAFVLYCGLLMAGIPQLKPQVANVAPDSVAARVGVQADAVVTAVDGVAIRSWGEADLLLLSRVLEKQPAVKLEWQQAGQSHTASVSLSGLAIGDNPGSMLPKLGIQVVPMREDTLIGAVMQPSAAAKAGLQPGDRILAIDGQPIANWRAMSERIRAAAGQAKRLSVQRGQQTLELVVTPEVHREGVQTFGRIGIQAAVDTAEWQRRVVTEPLSLGAAAQQTWRQGCEATRITALVLWRMLTLDISTKTLSGPVGIAQMAGQSVSAGLQGFFGFLVLMSFSLGFFNLLPIPVLDGGHLLMHGIEALWRRPLSERFREMCLRAGFAFIMLLTALAIYNDFYRLLLPR